MGTSLGTLSRTGAAPLEREIATGLAMRLGRGMTVAESFESLPGAWVGPLEVALVRSGELSGRLDHAFAMISRHHLARAENMASVIHGSVYPVLVLHATAFVAPLPMLVRTGNLLAYGARSAGVLACLYALTGWVAWAIRPHHRWRALVEGALIRVPVLGGALADLALARLAWSLEALLSAGMLVTEAWPISARAGGMARLERVVEGWSDALEAGATPGEMVVASGVFPEAFASSYLTGEASGRLEQELGRLARQHEEEGFRRLRMFGLGCPRVLYVVASAWMLLEIVSLATGYVSAVGELMAE